MSSFDFPKDFRKEDFVKILSFVTTGKFCQVISIPGAGKATLLRLLASNKNLRRFHLGEKERFIDFIYLNLLELENFDQAQIDKFLIHTIDPQIKPPNDSILLSKLLVNIVGRKTAGKKLILLFDHFDEFQNQLPRSFFQMLRNFKNAAKYNFSVVFATRRNLTELVDPEILKNFYDFFIDNAIYLKIFDLKATDVLFAQIEKVFEKEFDEKIPRLILKQTGGHAKLTKVTSELVARENIPLSEEQLLEKPIILATLYEIWFFLTAHEQKVLKLITQKAITQNDEVAENLIKFNLLNNKLEFTIPLFEAFIKTIIPTVQEKITFNDNTREIIKGSSTISELLSPQENRLLKFLIRNENRIIERSEIISAVWTEALVEGGISDEAIDQMIFRLRKKIEDEPNKPKHLITVKGQGLRFQS